MRNFDWTMLSQDFTVEHCYTQQRMRRNPFQFCSFHVCIRMQSISEAEQCTSRSFHYRSGVFKYFSAWTYQRIQGLKTLVHDDGINFTSAVNPYFASKFSSRNEQCQLQCTCKLITRPLMLLLTTFLWNKRFLMDLTNLTKLGMTCQEVVVLILSTSTQHHKELLPHQYWMILSTSVLVSISTLHL